MPAYRKSRVNASENAANIRQAVGYVHKKRKKTATHWTSQQNRLVGKLNLDSPDDKKKKEHNDCGGNDHSGDDTS